MMQKPGSWLALTILLGACAASPDSMDGNSPRREAAKVNAQLGQEYMQRGQLEVALDKLKKAVALDAAYAPAQSMLALLYERLDDIELAERHYRLAVRAAPDNGDVNNNFGVFLCQWGRADEAVPLFLKAVEDPFYRTPAVAYSNAGSCELRAGDLDKAEAYLRQSLEYDAEFPDSLLSLAELSMRQGEYLKARAFLQRYESTGSQTADSLLLGYRVETRLQNNAVASAYRDRLLNTYSDSEQAKMVRESSR